MKPVFIPGAGMWISAEVAADLRHGALRDLEHARRNHEFVAPDTVAAVEMLDLIGAAWVNNRVADVAPDVARLDPACCAPAEWSSMTVPAASDELKISETAVKGLLDRETLHGEQDAKGRPWRVCAESVAARKEGKRCQH